MAARAEDGASAGSAAAVEVASEVLEAAVPVAAGQAAVGSVRG